MNIGVVSPRLSRIMPVVLQYLWILPLCMGTIITIVETEQTTNFMWNKSNPMFQAAGGAKLTVAVGTNLVIQCPYKTLPDEYYRIYWVSEQGYLKCFRPQNDSKIMVICNQPNTQFEFTQEIRTFSGVPGGKDFKIGESYYLATFSTGTENGIANEINGACSDYNMKLNLTVVAQVPPSSTPGPVETSATTKKPETPSTPKPTTLSTESTTTKSTVLTTESTTVKPTTQKPQSSDIPDLTDIPVISVPDRPGTGGNTGVIDLTNSAQTPRASAMLLLSLCLSLLHILFLNRPYIQR